MVDQGTYLFGDWVGIVAAVGYFHTDVVLAGQISQPRIMSSVRNTEIWPVRDWAWCGRFVF
jgi:hypothetical protein